MKASRSRLHGSDANQDENWISTEDHMRRPYPARTAASGDSAMPTQQTAFCISGINLQHVEELQILQLLHQFITSNVTGRHWGLKRKLQAGYRVPSLQRTGWLTSTTTKTDVTCCYFSSPSVLSCAFSALCMYSKFRHHPHPLGYLCAKFCLFRNLQRWANPWRTSA